MFFLLFILSAQQWSSKDTPIEREIRSAVLLPEVFAEKEDIIIECTDIQQNNLTMHEKQCSLQGLFHVIQQSNSDGQHIESYGKTMHYNSCLIICKTTKNNSLEKQCIKIATLCYATMQNWREANGVMKKYALQYVLSTM